MGMPLDLYVIRHGESEANVIISAGEQGDNSLYTQDNVTVPDRSWRLTATGRKQGGLHRPLAGLTAAVVRSLPRLAVRAHA